MRYADSEGELPGFQEPLEESSDDDPDLDDGNGPQFNGSEVVIFEVRSHECTCRLLHAFAATFH